MVDPAIDSVLAEPIGEGEDNVLMCWGIVAVTDEDVDGRGVRASHLVRIIGSADKVRKSDLA